MTLKIIVEIAAQTSATSTEKCTMTKMRQAVASSFLTKMTIARIPKIRLLKGCSIPW